MADHTRIRLSVPARPEYVHMLRLVAAGMASRLDYPVDEIDDLRIAVAEGCAALLAAGGPAGVLDLRISASDRRMEIEISTDAQGDAWPPPGVENSLAWMVLSALTDEVRFEVEQGPVVRMIKRPAAAADRS
jgi:serine/threonine-protein kinase RsbW